MHDAGSVTRSLYLGHSFRMCCLVSRSASSQGRASGSLGKNPTLNSPMGAWHRMVLMALA